MGKNYVIILTSILIAAFLLVSVPLLVMEAYAVEEGDLIGGTCERICVNNGAISLISQIDGSQTLIGDPTTEGSLPGLVFDSSGTLWGINNIDISPTNPRSHLIQIDPDTGTQIGSSIPITLNGNPIALKDLAADPETGELFATSLAISAVIVPHQLVTIDKSTGAITIVGTLPNVGFGIHSIGFDPNTGAFYDVPFQSSFVYTINPADASVVSTVVTTPTLFTRGLTVSDDGTIWVTNIQFGSTAIWTIDPTTGAATLVGSGTPNAIVDLAFVPTTNQAPEQAIQNLIDTVVSMNLQQGTENSLISNLDSAIEKLVDNNPNNDSAACGKLDSFENKVDAQDGKKLNADQATTLRGLAEDILAAIGCS